MAKFTLDYTGEQINEALGLALNGSTDALKKTGDTMEGVLKFTPEVHYGASLPETGETGQIYFVKAEEVFLEDKDGVVKTNNVDDKAITRAKLANDALYSPLIILSDIPEYALTVADIGKTFRAAQTSNNITITSENSSAIPLGAEFAVLRYSNSNDVTITFDGVNVCSPGWDTYMQGGKIKVVDNYGMIALKRITNANMWLVTGNVEVVS